MDGQRKELLIENLSAAALVGLITLLVTAASILVEHATIARERVALERLSGRSVSTRPVSGSALNNVRLYRLEGKGAPRLGTVACLGTQGRSRMVAFVFAADGELEAAEMIGESDASIPIARDGWFSDFVGKGAERPYPMLPREARRPDALAGATESFAATGKLLTRLSDMAKHVSKKE